MHRFSLATLLFLFVSSTVFAQDQFFSIGSGGGFTGTASVFKVTPSGKVFKGDGIGEVQFTECGKIKKAKAKQMLKRISDVTQSTTSFNHPGNLFYFISYTEDNNKRTITWGDVDHPIQEDVKKLYEEVLANVSAVSYKPIH
jgi:hypothetical protein